MGTIHDQAARMSHLKEDRIIMFSDKIFRIAEESKISYMEALETFKLVALIDQYDAGDEQISGAAELVERLCEALEGLNE